MAKRLGGKHLMHVFENRESIKQVYSALRNEKHLGTPHNNMLFLSSKLPGLKYWAHPINSREKGKAQNSQSFL